MGAHPLHQRCLELYSCLASACRVCARRGAGVAALRRATLYGLLQAAAVEAMLAVGDSRLAAERKASCLSKQTVACQLPCWITREEHVPRMNSLPPDSCGQAAFVLAMPAWLPCV